MRIWHWCWAARRTNRMYTCGPDTAARMKEYVALRAAKSRVTRTARRCSAPSAIRAETVFVGPSPVSACRIDRYLRLTGLKRERVSNHVLRHTAATLAETGDLLAVQELLGYADPRDLTVCAGSGHGEEDSGAVIPVKLNEWRHLRPGGHNLDFKLSGNEAGRVWPPVAYPSPVEDSVAIQQHGTT